MAANSDGELRRRFLDGMSHAACTVNVVTTDGPAGRFGTTVSAMSAVSADSEKPTLLVCIHEKSSSAEPIVVNGVFCVNVLRDDQSFISDCFAGRTAPPTGDKFSCTQWVSGKTGSPRVADAMVAFDCRILSQQKIGTHYVFLGAVEDIVFERPGPTLIYANRAYGTPLRMSEPGLATGAETKETLRLGVFHTFGPYIVPEVLERLARRGQRIAPRLLEGDQERLVEALNSSEIELALIYDWELGDHVTTERLTGLWPHVLLSPANPLSQRAVLSFSDLVDQPLVLLDARPSGDFFLSLFAERGLKPKVAYRSTSFEMVRGIVGHDLGYSILVAKPASNMTYDGRALCTRPLSDPVAPRYLALAWRSYATWSEPASAFATVCREFLAANCAPSGS